MIVSFRAIMHVYGKNNTCYLTFSLFLQHQKPYHGSINKLFFSAILLSPSFIVHVYVTHWYAIWFLLFCLLVFPNQYLILSGWNKCSLPCYIYPMYNNKLKMLQVLQLFSITKWKTTNSWSIMKTEEKIIYTRSEHLLVTPLPHKLINWRQLWCTEHAGIAINSTHTLSVRYQHFALKLMMIIISDWDEFEPAALRLIFSLKWQLICVQLSRYNFICVYNMNEDSRACCYIFNLTHPIHNMQWCRLNQCCMYLQHGFEGYVVAVCMFLVK